MKSLLLCVISVALLTCACSGGTARVDTATRAPANWSSATLAMSMPGLEDAGARRDEQLDFAAAQGVTGIRIPVRWSSVEPREGQFDWGPLDQTVRSASSRGLAILGVVTWAPSWAVDTYYRSLPHPAPRSAAAFAHFAGEAAARYRDSVSAWEIWNEPNIAVNFGPVVDVDRYCDILRRSYSAIKSASPTASVITGGTSPAQDTSTSVSPANFVNALYTCAPTSFDAVAMHPYPGEQLLSRQTQRTSSAFQLSQVHEVMKYRGDDRRSVWFTEFGVPTGPSGVSDARQEAILVDGVYLLRQLPYAGPLFVFMLRDISTGSLIPDYNYGLVRSDFSVKPSLKAVLALYRQ